MKKLLRNKYILHGAILLIIATPAVVLTCIYFLMLLLNPGAEATGLPPYGIANSYNIWVMAMILSFTGFMVGCFFSLNLIIEYIIMLWKKGFVGIDELVNE